MAPAPSARAFAPARGLAGACRRAAERTSVSAARSSTSPTSVGSDESCSSDSTASAAATSATALSMNPFAPVEGIPGDGVAKLLLGMPWRPANCAYAVFARP